MFYDYINDYLTDKFEFHNCHNAIEILAEAYPFEWYDLQVCLLKMSESFEISDKEYNDTSRSADAAENYLISKGWKPACIKTEMTIKYFRRDSDNGDIDKETNISSQYTIPDYFAEVEIDALKNSVAFKFLSAKDDDLDIEIARFNNLFDIGAISVAVLLYSDHECYFPEYKKFIKSGPVLLVNREKILS